MKDTVNNIKEVSETKPYVNMDYATDCENLKVKVNLLEKDNKLYEDEVTQLRLEIKEYRVITASLANLLNDCIVE